LTLCLLPLLYRLAWVSRQERYGAKRTERVSRQQFGDEWPFIVDEGAIQGRGWGSVTFKAGGDVYAVNGLAKGQGFKDIEPIWADDPETGSKKNIGPIIDRGLALCA
jgi:hypothetical protein